MWRGRGKFPASAQARSFRLPFLLRPELSISGLGVRMAWGGKGPGGVPQPEGEKAKPTHVVWPFPKSHALHLLAAPSPYPQPLRGTLLCRLVRSRKGLLCMFKLAAPKVPSACHNYALSTFPGQMGKLRLQGV